MAFGLESRFGLGFRIRGGVSSFAFDVVGFGVWGFGFSGFRVSGFGLRGSGLGFKVDLIPM